MPTLASDTERTLRKLGRHFLRHSWSSAAGAAGDTRVRIRTRRDLHLRWEACAVSGIVHRRCRCLFVCSYSRNRCFCVSKMSRTLALGRSAAGTATQGMAARRPRLQRDYGMLPHLATHRAGFASQAGEGESLAALQLLLRGGPAARHLAGALAAGAAAVATVTTITTSVTTVALCDAPGRGYTGTPWANIQAGEGGAMGRLRGLVGLSDEEGAGGGKSGGGGGGDDADGGRGGSHVGVEDDAAAGARGDGDGGGGGGDGNGSTDEVSAATGTDTPVNDAQTVSGGGTVTAPGSSATALASPAPLTAPSPTPLTGMGLMLELAREHWAGPPKV